MAKRKTIEAWDNNDVDSLMDALFDKAKQYYGDDNIYTGTEAEQRIVGIKMPALSLRYLLQSSVFPLSRMTQLVGTESAGKSTLLYEIMRWHRLAGGRNLLLESESKDSPELRNMVLNHDPKAILTKPCDCLEDWQEGLLHFIKWGQELLDGTPAKPGPGRIRPLCCGIDSLTGKAARETEEKVCKAGFAERSYAIEANLISTFMKVMPQKIAEYPFSIVGTNHLKPATDARGMKVRNVPGGRSIKFQETFEIELSHVRDIEKAQYSGYTVKIYTLKNSLGARHKAIYVDVIFWNDVDPETNEVRPMMFWDWEGASIQFLIDMKTKKHPIYPKIEEILDLHPIRTTSNRVWSTALGTDSSNPQTFRDAGKELEKHPEILNALYPLLGIRQRMEFVTGEDYREQRKKAREQALKYDTTPKVMGDIPILEDSEEIDPAYLDSIVED